MNLLYTAINGAWWFGNMLWVGEEAYDVKNKLQDTLGSSSATGRDYVVAAGKTATLALDIASLSKDWQASKLTDKSLEMNRITSAKIQALAMATEGGTNFISKGYVLDTKIIMRMFALARRTGQAKDLPKLTEASTVIEICSFVAATGYIIQPV